MVDDELRLLVTRLHFSGCLFFRFNQPWLCSTAMHVRYETCGFMVVVVDTRRRVFPRTAGPVQPRTTTHSANTKKKSLIS